MTMLRHLGRVSSETKGQTSNAVIANGAAPLVESGLYCYLNSVKTCVVIYSMNGKILTSAGVALALCNPSTTC